MLGLKRPWSAEDSSLKDHDRPLTAWGRTLAAELGKNLGDAGAGWGPDLVLCSGSQRSRETLREMTTVHAALAAAETHFLGSLYHFAAMDGVTATHLRETILATVSRRPEVRTVMCVGHNKGWEEAASDFAGKEVKLKVANAALLECGGGESWAVAFAEGSAVRWKLRGVVEHGVAAPPAGEGAEGAEEWPTPIPM